MNLTMKQKVKFLVIEVIEKLLYLGQLRNLLTYHFNMVDAVFIIDITALFKTERLVKFPEI